MAFERGAAVRTRAQRTAGHTRLPAYLQQKPGIVRDVLGEFPLPDENARDGVRARRSRLYAVEFKASDVWGEASEGKVHADLFEEYLEATP